MAASQRAERAETPWRPSSQPAGVSPVFLACKSRTATPLELCAWCLGGESKGLFLHIFLTARGRQHTIPKIPYAKHSIHARIRRRLRISPQARWRLASTTNNRPRPIPSSACHPPLSSVVTSCMTCLHTSCPLPVPCVQLLLHIAARVAPMYHSSRTSRSTTHHARTTDRPRPPMRKFRCLTYRNARYAALAHGALRARDDVDSLRPFALQRSSKQRPLSSLVCIAIGHLSLWAPPSPTSMAWRRRPKNKLV